MVKWATEMIESFGTQKEQWQTTYYGFLAPGEVDEADTIRQMLMALQKQGMGVEQELTNWMMGRRAKGEVKVKAGQRRLESIIIKELTNKALLIIQSKATTVRGRGGIGVRGSLSGGRQILA